MAVNVAVSPVRSVVIEARDDRYIPQFRVDDHVSQQNTFTGRLTEEMLASQTTLLKPDTLAPA